MVQISFPSDPGKSSQIEPILEHGFSLIAKSGVKAFTVESLARDLAMSKKTIYKFFPSRDLLIYGIFHYVTTVITGFFRKIIDQEINPIDKFYKILDEIISMLNRISISKIGELKARYPKIWREVEAFRLARRDDFLLIIREGQDQEYIRRDLDAHLTATLFMNIVNTVFQPEFFLNNQLNPNDVLVTFREIFLKGIATEKGLKHIEDHL